MIRVTQPDREKQDYTWSNMQTLCSIQLALI